MALFENLDIALPEACLFHDLSTLHAVFLWLVF
jgi:hypothetical protein